MRKIEIFNADTFELLDMCYQFESVTVNRKFRGVGNINIVLNSIEEGDKFNLENYVLFNDETYIVEDLHKYKDAHGIVKIEVFGSHINRLIEHRVLLPNVSLETGKIAQHYQINQGESYSAIAVRMVQECFTELVSPYDSGEWLERIASLDFVAHGESLQSESSYTLQAPVVLTEALNRLLGAKKLGYCVKVDYEQKKHVFHVYEPEEVNVVFSETFGNINDADVYSNITDEKTKAIYASDETLLYEASGSNMSGFRRKELIHDNSSSDWKTSHKSKTNASFDIVDNGSFKYRTDYDLGDIVEYYNKTFGISTTQQIAEVTETYDSIETISIKIGDFIPTIYDRLKGAI